MSKTLIINSPFSTEASPPSLNADIYNIRYNLEKKLNNIDLIDMDSKIYMYLKDDYDLIYYLLGGFPFSYPTNSFVPLNVYPFETLPTGPLIMDILMGLDVSKSLNEVCKKLGLDYKISISKFNKMLGFFDEQAESLRNYEEIIFFSDSIVSCILSSYLARKCKVKCLIGVGKNYFIPLLTNILTAYVHFKAIFEDKYKLYENMNMCDVDQSSFNFSDVNIKDYEFGYGIGHVMLMCGSGCPNKCKFCSIRLNWNQNDIIDCLLEETNDIISEKIDHIYNAFGITFIHLGMSTFNANEKKAIKLLKILEQKKALFSTNLTVKSLSNNFITHMMNAHFFKVIIGVESVNKNMLSMINKGTIIDYDRYISDVLRIKKKFEKCNIISQMNILLFYPGQSKNDIEEIIKDWQNLFIKIYQKGISIRNIPIGTLCLNYPSEMYKDVINNPDYEIFYHKLSDEQKETKIFKDIAKIYEKIPNYAVYGKSVSVDNKMFYVNKLKEYEDKDMEIDINHFLNQCYPFTVEISTKWTNERKRILLNQEISQSLISKEVEWFKHINAAEKSYKILKNSINSSYEKQLVLLILCLVFSKKCTLE